MIESILIFNQQGKPRIIKNYDDRINKSELIKESYNLIKDRKDVCNFINQGQYTLVYRNYATLYFCLLINQQESLLASLDLIHVLVESLDKLFESVCELDLIFNFDKVHLLIDQFVQGGLVIETNVNQIVNSCELSRPLFITTNKFS